MYPLHHLMRRSPHHWLFTVAAVFLLLFTAVDLAYPEMCAEDGDNDSAVVSSSTPVNTITASAADSHGTVPMHADDCFCCCGHVIAGAIFHVVIPQSGEQTRFAQAAKRVTGAPPAAYRPPRLA